MEKKGKGPKVARYFMLLRKNFGRRSGVRLGLERAHGINRISTRAEDDSDVNRRTEKVREVNY